MEESISSSRTSSAFYCNDNDGYGITAAAASDDSGWTAYFDDFLQASRAEAAPAREKLRHGVCATASTPSSSANRKKAVKAKAAGQEKKRPRNFELEDPLQDTASSPANATQQQEDMYSLRHACTRFSCSTGQTRPPSAQQWSAGDVNGAEMGQLQQQEAADECYTELQKGGVCLH